MKRVFVLLVLCLLVLACKKKSGAVADDPTLDVRDSSEGLLLTWVDDKGEFHTEMRVQDVPMMGRDSVKVVDPNKDDGTHADKVFVVDLRSAGADGRYPVHTMSRSDFDAIAVERREKRGLATLANAAEAGAGVQTPPDLGGGGAGDVARPLVIIYGAEWCGPCHEAAAYMKRKNIPFVEKDIERDPQAAREMQAKLRATGQRNGSIPVIDVRGKLIVGFSPGAVDAALGHST